MTRIKTRAPAAIPRTVVETGSDEESVDDVPGVGAGSVQ
jgi:hypothetical protein